jgi:hypothetical protein
MIIPGPLIALATFPGVIIHEAAHLLFCKWARVPVFDVCFFRFGNPAGYVVHQEPTKFSTSFFISMGPFFVNSLLCIVLCFPAFVPVRIFDRPDPVSYFLLWLGLSIGMHAFPSTGDANVLWKQARKAAAKLNPLAIVSLPLVGVLYLANFGRIFWLDLMYGIAIGLALPEYVFNHVL